ncbi:nuclear transport factor 2 family protein [Serratia plymuthica]|uniref:nuclear transport factor 2 family protein n=1 Tax=Serratia TaxID=613 RepID=UPI0002A3D5FE|nr:nuclear transport factor 2 family protein [Serratia plymuthica]ANJ96113.1 steroid delta-isomerase [Serratia plymuthica]ANJ98447.1 steroid delta-isomerase [Serratia plymuthica]EKF64684.1 steroid delta-isomerase domain protein [Serratia plymuthica A30]MBI6136851.1 nuclear transport factor 2 family protein [Serratia plymuthica]UJD99111.1 steroid delta-isomerase [Serratia plymuthica]
MNNKTIRPEDVVQQQLDAYNARDIDAFMAYWAEDAQYYEHPDTLLASGKAEIRERHIARFKEPSLYGERVKRMVLGSMVIDQEVVTRNFPQGRGKMDVIAIYEVEQGKIVKAWFKVGPCELDEGAL